MEVQSDPNLLRYYTETIVTDRKLITSIFKRTDPDTYELFQLFDSPEGNRTKHGPVFRTFNVGLDKMDELLDEYPEFDGTFQVQDAWVVIGSKLIRFEPDEWIKNAKLLTPILTGKKSPILPDHVRLRLEELNRSFIFGNWLAVISLSRSVLEYALLDNCHVTYPRKEERKKDLKTLIDDRSKNNKELFDLMDFVRDVGNKFIHPEKTGISETMLSERRDWARRCIEKLTHAIEILYLPKNEA